MANIIPFRFTVTTDLHSHVYESCPFGTYNFFQNACDEINSKFGSAGDFMISTGDISDAWPSWYPYYGTAPDRFRTVIDDRFGFDFRWVTAVGNHDISDTSGTGIEWIRKEWNGSNPSGNPSAILRESTEDYAFPGPDGCSTTQYYFFHKGIMFIVMNWYWDGTNNLTADEDGFNNDTDASGGKIIDEQLDWLRNLFSTYSNYHKIICAHGNAFAFADRHSDYSGLGGSTKDNRDILWRLMEESRVVAYIHGHTHERRIDYVDNTYWSGGDIEDNWSYGESAIPHISAGQIESKWPDPYLWGTNKPTFMNIVVTETSIKFDIYESITQNAHSADPGWQIILTTTVPLTKENKGGVWYYTQDKFGTEWFNNVNNKKGWTLDFNLRVSDIQNNELLVDERDKSKGVGIYVNDGDRQEVINFLTQEIVFANANQSIVYDSTVENDYRLIGKKDNLKLFAKLSTSSNYSEIADINFTTVATSNGNASNPVVFEDVSGNLHASWCDDGNGVNSIFYSKFIDNSWSKPEEIVLLDHGVQFPSIIVDSDEIVYVVFESKETEGSIIGLIYKDNLGWSKPYYTGQGIGSCCRPKLIFDSQSNACVVWEDNRQEYPEIYLNIFLRDELIWKEEKKLSNNIYGSYRPSIASYMDDIFISWTRMDEDNTSSIEAIKYNAITSVRSSVATISGTTGKADYSNILINVTGKVFIVWHDNISDDTSDDISGNYKIYASILTPTFDFLTIATAIVDGNDGARYPVLSEQLSTGYIYIVWQDFKDNFHENISVKDIRPSNSTVFIAYYKDGVFVSSGNGDNDIMLSFEDDRDVYFPSVPIFFRGELPIVYESYSKNRDEYEFIGSSNMLMAVKSTYYNLSRDNSVFFVNYGDDEYGIDRDFNLNKLVSTREIRFGDFSNVLNAHYVFKEFKYYLDDAVEPHQIKEINANTVDIDSLSVYDAQVNNSGDTWIVGPCGMYYFVDRYNKMIQVGPENDILGLEDVDPLDLDAVAIEYENLKKFKVIAFDNYNNMYIGGEERLIRYSTSHIKGFKELNLLDIPSEATITSIVFDKDNIMFIGTSSGIYIYDQVVIETNIISDYSKLRNIDVTKSSSYDNFDNLVDYHITSLKIDVNNCLWIGTSNNGMYRFHKDHLLHFTTTHGLPSNIVNDIAIRNTAVRYIATSSGIVKMVGFNFDNTISSKDNIIWNNNVKSIEWKDPNVLLAGTMSRTNQIIINDDDNTYNTVFYEPSSSLNISADDFNVYCLTDLTDLTDTDILEVYINGNLVHFGYSISSDNKIIRFQSSLNNYDVVEVVVRKDLEKISSFYLTQDEINNDGNTIVRINSLENLGNNLYVVSSGDKNEVKINDSDCTLPFDKVHLDTKAPRFLDVTDGIKIGEQVDSSIVKITIEGATDSTEEIEGSGIEGMIISNYDNFTTNGSIPQSYVPFSTSVNHDLGISLEDVITELTFASGSGSVISYISSDNELYAATSKPAIVYKYNWLTEEWESLYTYDNDQYIDFIIKYNNKLLISVGHDTDIARIYVYDYPIDDLSLSDVLPITESRAYCSRELNNKLYIGSGNGLGDEYVSGAGDGGSVYLFNDGTSQSIDPDLTKIVENIDENIYSMTNVEGSTNLLVVTGPEGYIYEVDIENQAAFIVYNSSEDLTSISFLERSNNSMIFAGGKTSGTIRKTLFGSNTYDITFRTTPAKVSAMKILQVIVSTDSTQNYLTVYASVGNTVYYLSESGTWVWKYTHDEEINDITLNENKNSLYVISDSGITRVKPLVDSKAVYLKLIDRAGNETTLDPIPVTQEEINNEPLVDSINITNLTDFINENKIFEIDELGNTLYTLKGNNKFYSADKIEKEKGEYISEIFDGSNDLVKWETISWESTELINTKVLMYVRSSTSRNDILIADWIGPFDNSQSAGVNISSLVGQFIQFKVVLTSDEKGVTPSFYRASIRAITGESVHFFTTNFTMPTKINKGIITSQKVVPVSADIVFAINTTNSIDWTEYQPVDENRIFNINQTGHNLRVGIKFISPNRSLTEPTAYDEYGPYNSNLYVNTIDFDFINNSGITRDYHFKITLYSDINLTEQVFSACSADCADGFSSDGIAIPGGGVSISHSETSNILFTVPGSANITCNTYYFVKVEYIYDTSFELFSDDYSFVASCTSSFIDNIDFDFTNNEASANYYHFRIKFYQDIERTNEYLTIFSGNNRSGWFVDDVQIPEEGALVLPGEAINIVYRPTSSDFSIGSIYYLTIEAHDGDDYVFSSNSYTFQIKDVQSTEYCGEYIDVPIVKNFGIMFELDNNEFVTLNI